MNEKYLAKYFDENITEVMAYVSKVVPLIIDIPKDIYEDVEPEARYYLYNQFCLKFVLGLLFYPFDYEPKEITYIKPIDTIYYLAEKDMMMGQERPMHNLNALPYTNALDLKVLINNIGEGSLSRFAELICVIVKKNRNDKYHHKQINDYLYEIKQLDMESVWDVFFYLNVFARKRLELLTGLILEGRHQSMIQVGMIN